MKRLSFLVLCAALTAFAGPYDIESFDAQDSGSPDEYISAEFGGELKTVPASEVESLQEGRLVVRQKFQDPFGESEPTYQLYQGGAGDLSSLTPMSASSASISDLVSAKIYKRRGLDAEDDVEKVYFDSKFVYIPGLSSAIAFVNDSPVDLKGDAPAASEDEDTETETASAKKATVECDEYDTDCDDDDDEYDVSGDVSNTNRIADERDYAASGAAEDATDRFGIADEVRFWSGIVLSAVAVGGAVMGVLQHMKANEAQDAYDDLKELDDALLEGCHGNKACEDALKNYGADEAGKWSIKNPEDRMATNKKTHDSYAMWRNVWFGVTGVSLTAAIVLFVW